jgi:hypothetical protein
MCHAVFQDLPFKIHVLTPAHIGRSGSRTWKVRLPLRADVFSYQQNIVIYFWDNGAEEFGKGVKKKAEKFQETFCLIFHSVDLHREKTAILRKSYLCQELTIFQNVTRMSLSIPTAYK